MLSRRVIAYYGLMRASESLPAAYGFAAGAAAPKENGLRWESRGSPIYSAGLCSRAASHTPATRSVRLTVPSSSVLAFTPVSRVRRHIGSFEAAEFTHSQVHRNCYGPRAGLPSFRGRLHSSLRRRGRPQSASNMTTWINSQFPRPDFHRQVQRHYGLQDTGFPPPSFRARMMNCRVGKGRPAGSFELRVSPSPSKIPYGGFSPVRLQMDRQQRPSTTSRGLSAVHIRLMRPSYTPPQLQLRGIRDPRRDYPFENLSVQCGTTPNN